MRAVSSSRSMASLWRLLCWEKGDLSPNNLQMNQFSRAIKLEGERERESGRRRRRRRELHVACTGRRATREERSVPCRRRGGTDKGNWLSDISTSPASSVSLPFVSLPFPTPTQLYSVSMEWHTRYIFSAFGFCYADVAASYGMAHQIFNNTIAEDLCPSGPLQ